MKILLRIHEEKFFKKKQSLQCLVTYKTKFMYIFNLPILSHVRFRRLMVNKPSTINKSTIHKQFAVVFCEKYLEWSLFRSSDCHSNKNRLHHRCFDKENKQNYSGQLFYSPPMKECFLNKNTKILRGIFSS